MHQGLSRLGSWTLAPITSPSFYFHMCKIKVLSFSSLQFNTCAHSHSIFLWRCCLCFMKLYWNHSLIDLANNVDKRIKMSLIIRVEDWKCHSNTSFHHTYLQRISVDYAQLCRKALPLPSSMITLPQFPLI